MARLREFDMAVKKGSQGTEIRLEGVISEMVELDAGRVPSGRPVVIDAGGIANLNSLGVRNWIRFLDALCNKTPQVVLRRLSPMLVFQASMISTFLSRARVESYLSPWCCVECDTTTILTHGLQEELPDTIPCPNCRAQMEFDSDSDAYQTFRYLAMQQG